jgi:hypothetical protein
LPAQKTIRGFVFQVNLTALQWLDLRENEHLELECGKEIDVVGKAVGDVIARALAPGEVFGRVGGCSEP